MDSLFHSLFKRPSPGLFLYTLLRLFLTLSDPLGCLFQDGKNLRSVFFHFPSPENILPTLHTPIPELSFICPREHSTIFESARFEKDSFPLLSHFRH